MKKILFLILLIVLMPFKTYAFSDEDGVYRYYINVDVLENGDMKISEAIILKGDLNGFFRDIPFRNNYATEFTGKDSDFLESSIYNASGITDLKVYDIVISEPLGFNLTKSKGVEFEKVNSASKGEKYKYTLEETSEMISLVMYNKSSDTTGFLIEYTVKDAVVVHDDVAEIYWQFVSEYFENNISLLEVIINLPGESSDIKAWGHGPLYGEAYPQLPSTINAEITNMNSGEPLDLRTVFDKSLVSSSTKFSNVAALDKIIDIETKKADEANAIREKLLKEEEELRRLANIYLICCLFWVIGLLIIIIRVYFKYDKEYKPKFNVPYYREFPASYGPEIVEYLVKNKKISPNSLTAMVTDLIRKKALEVEEVPNDKKNYRFKKTDNEVILTKTEDFVMDWFIKKIGDGSSVTTKEIENCSKKYSSSKEFMDNYNKWSSSVTTEAKGYDFFEENKTGKRLSFIYALVGTVVFSIIFVGILFGVPALIYFTKFTKKSQNGIEEYSKWMAFKKFLKDFGRMDEKQLPEVILWEKYLVYATAFGIAKEVEKSMKIRLSEMDTTNTNYNYHYNSFMFNSLINSAINNTVTRTLSNSNREIIAHSAASSGGGGGGGFSSGGGGGFGGGGGGGRF